MLIATRPILLAVTVERAEALNLKKATSKERCLSINVQP